MQGITDLIVTELLSLYESNRTCLIGIFADWPGR